MVENFADGLQRFQKAKFMLGRKSNFTDDSAYLNRIAEAQVFPTLGTYNKSCY